MPQNTHAADHWHGSPSDDDRVVVVGTGLVGQGSTGAVGAAIPFKEKLTRLGSRTP